MSLKRLKLSGGDKLGYLLVLDGLAVSIARQIISRHSFASIQDFAVSWFIHLLGVGLFAPFAGASILYGRKFWLGGDAEKDWPIQDVLFAVLMTVLIAAIFSVIVATAGPPDEFGD